MLREQVAPEAYAAQEEKVKKVLIVDDEPNVCLIVKNLLESTGKYEAMSCTNSSEALDLAKRSRPDLILLDINMPGLTGPDLAQQLRNARATKDIPFIYLTAMVVKEEVEEANHMMGGRYFAAKPVRREELLHVIDLVFRDRLGEDQIKETLPKKRTIHFAELLGHKITIQEGSDGTFQMSITGMKSVEGNTAFSTLPEAQEAAHALIHFHLQRVKYCTCGKPLEWKQSVQ